MEIIIGDRRSGKTTAIVKELGVNDIYVSLNMQSNKIAYDMWCKEHNVEVKNYGKLNECSRSRPTFMTYAMLISKYFDVRLGDHIENIYIDNAEEFFSFFLPAYGIKGKFKIAATATPKILKLKDNPALKVTKKS